jgi:hypothetical protein
MNARPKTLVAAERQDGTLPSKRRVAGRPPGATDGDPFGQEFSRPLAIGGIGQHERRGSHIEDERSIGGRHAEGNGVGADGRPDAAGGRHATPRAAAAV